MPTPPSNGKSKLTELERKFALEFLKDGKGGPALLRAGSKSRDIYSASSAATQILKKLKVQEEIQRLRDESRGDKPDNLQQYLAPIKDQILYDPRKCFDSEGNPLPIHQLPEREARALTGFRLGMNRDGKVFTRDTRYADRAKAAELVLRAEGYLKEDQTVNKVEIAFVVVDR